MDSCDDDNDNVDDCDNSYDEDMEQQTTNEKSVLVFDDDHLFKYYRDDTATLIHVNDFTVDDVVRQS
jgi:hypothetical protein